MVSVDVTFVGHSKGGGEAIAAAVVTGMDAITFNAANFDFTSLGLSEANAGIIRNFYVSGDILYHLLGPADFGTTIMLPMQFANISAPSILPTYAMVLDALQHIALIPQYSIWIPGAIANHGRSSVVRAVRDWNE
jgi:hypothetical protein